jgi:predicted ester cyclase
MLLPTRWRRTQVGKEEQAAVSSEAEENKAIARRFLEEHMAKGNLDVIDELLSPDFVDRSLMPGQGPTREDFKRSVAEILEAYPITSFTIEEQIAEGDTVVTKYWQSSVHRGEIMGIPPTGKEITGEGIYIHRISGGKITEEWGMPPEKGVPVALVMSTTCGMLRLAAQSYSSPGQIAPAS